MQEQQVISLMQSKLATVYCFSNLESQAWLHPESSRKVETDHIVPVGQKQKVSNNEELGLRNKE